MEQQPNKVWGNFKAGMLGRVANQCIGFVLVVYLARVLGPKAYGNISLVLAVISYFNLLASFGLSTVGIREVARGGKQREDAINQILSLRICLAGLAYGLLFVYGYYVIDDTDFFYLLLLYGLTLLSASWLLDWVFIGMEDLRSLAMANVIGSFCSCVFIFFLVKSAADIFYIPVGMFAGAVLACIYLFYAFRKVHAMRGRFTCANWRPILRIAMPFAVTSGLGQLYENFDMILLGFVVGPQDVGYYSVAYKIVVVLSGIIAIYSQSTFPVMIRLRETNPRLLGEFLKQNVQVILYFMLPIVTGGTMLAGNIIETFFGEAYKQATSPFILLLYYVLLMALSITLANWLLAVNEDKKYMRTLILGSFINVAANLVLIPLWKAVGAAAAMIIAEIFVFCFLAAKVKALQQADWLEKRCLFISVASCGVMGFGIFIVQRLFHLHVGFMILWGALIYMGLSWPFCAKSMRGTITE